MVIVMAAETVVSLCFPPEDFTVPAQHLDSVMPGMWAAMHACNNQGNGKILP